MPKSNKHLDGQTSIKVETIAYFGCNEAATCITLLQKPDGEFEITFEVNGILQRHLTVKVESEDPSDAAFEFDWAVQKVLGEVLK